MGKTVRWFRKLLGGKTVVEPNSKPAKEKKGWRFLRSLHNRRELVADDGNEEKSVERKHAITPAEAEAAAAIAGGRGRTVPAYCSGKREDAAAVKIQAAFRCHLARRALRALKGLVKLQALVRGYIVRKQMLETLHCMHALVRAQARALAGRTHCLNNQHLNKKDPQHLYGPAPTALTGNASKFDSTDTYELERMREVRNLLDPWVDEWSLSHAKHRNTNLQSSQSNVHSFSTLPGSPSKDSTTAQASILSLSSVEMLCKSDRSAYETADNSPEFFSASSKPGSGNRGPFTPSKSDRSWSFLSMYSNYPNYMAETESSRAKVRSQSAPKQRPELENCSSAKRFSVHGCEDVFLAKFRSKGYPGSGQLDGLGMPIDYNVINRRNMY